MKFANLSQTIKKVLKNQKKQYSDLGNHIGLSVSGVKKLLNGNDCSCNRLQEICEFLNTSVIDLIEVTANSKAPTLKLTSNAQRHFEAYPECLDLLFAILYERSSFQALKKTFNFETADLFKHLRLLDSENIIKWDQDNRIVSLHPAGLIEGDRDFLNLFKSRLAKLIFDQNFDSEQNRPNKLWRVKVLQSSDQAYAKLFEDLNEAISNFEERSFREISTRSQSKLKPRQLLCIANTGRVSQ